jgi:hypothetical protein
MNIANEQVAVRGRSIPFIVIPLLLLWMLTIVVLGLNKVFVSAPGEAPLALLISFTTTFSVFALAYLSLPAFRQYILTLDMRFLIMLHSWRMLGMGFIMLNLFDQLPALFAYLAGLGDALTAIGAVFLAYALFRHPTRDSRRWIWRWNTFGLIDFVIAVGTGLLTRSDALLAPASGINSDLMTTFPFVIIPGFLVQVFALTHIIIYLQLRNQIQRKFSTHHSGPA